MPTARLTVAENEAPKLALPLAALRQALAECFIASGGQKLAALAAAAPSPLTSVTVELRYRARRASGNPLALATAALFRLRLGEEIGSRAGLWQLCRSLHLPCGWEQARPLDDPRLLQRLFAKLAGLGDDRLFESCYRELLVSYFSACRDYCAGDLAMPPGGSPGWRLLAAFLRQHLGRVCPETAAPAGDAPIRSGAGRSSGWRRALLRQRTLLTLEEPARLGAALGQAAVKNFLLRLGVS